MASKPRRGRALNSQVFVNCPFDEDYRPCFEALLFAITISGYQARCAPEESDAGDIRFDKLRRLISNCDHSIHDLSRIETVPEGLPRFNMPFELGLMMGARSYGGTRQRLKRACIMVARDYVMPKYLSDLAGNDPAAHGGEPAQVIRIVRDYFHTDPQGNRLAGAAHLLDLFAEFRADLAALARAARLMPDEVHPRRSYRNFMAMLEVFQSISKSDSGSR